MMTVSFSCEFDARTPEEALDMALILLRDRAVPLDFCVMDGGEKHWFTAPPVAEASK